MDQFSNTEPIIPRGAGAAECRFVMRAGIDPYGLDPLSNFDGIRLIDSQVGTKCGGHAMNNLFQRRVIEVCDLREGLDIDAVIRLVKRGDRRVKVYSCDRTMAQLLLEMDPSAQVAPDLHESQSDYIYRTPDQAQASIERNLGNILGFIEFTGGHYVSWVYNNVNGFWYRIESMYRGGGRELGGTICKFSVDDMLEYIRNLRQISIAGGTGTVFSGACRLLIVARVPFPDLSARSTVEEEISRARAEHDNMLAAQRLQRQGSLRPGRVRIPPVTSVPQFRSLPPLPPDPIRATLPPLPPDPIRATLPPLSHSPINSLRSDPSISLNEDVTHMFGNFYARNLPDGTREFFERGNMGSPTSLYRTIRRKTSPRRKRKTSPRRKRKTSPRRKRKTSPRRRKSKKK